jgi:hypothetical protein
MSGLALLCGSVLLLGACTSGFTYVKNSDSNTFFKVPKNWTLINGQDFTPTTAPLGQQQPARGNWEVVFDANPKPIRGTLFQTPRYPQGFAIIQPLSDQERDGVSLGSLRNLVFPIDQMLTQDPQSVQILRNEDLVLSDGFRGSRIIYTVKRTADLFTVNQTGLIDMETRSLYLFVVACEVHCYEQNQKTIDEIVKSWTVKKSGR